MAQTRTRIQTRNREVILAAGVSVFAAQGFRGATLDEIAKEAGLSKPNLLYYFPSKEAIYTSLLEELLDMWLDPLRSLDATGSAKAELLAYVDRKLTLSRDFPQESRLFANEILQGAPRIEAILSNDLKDLVDEKAKVIEAWSASGEIAPVDPHHLIFSIWSLTQHYADFDAQVRAVLGKSDPFPDAKAHLDQIFDRILTPEKPPKT